MADYAVCRNCGTIFEDLVADVTDLDWDEAFDDLCERCVTETL
jgi:hypothetical protein